MSKEQVTIDSKVIVRSTRDPLTSKESVSSNIEKSELRSSMPTNEGELCKKVKIKWVR